MDIILNIALFIFGLVLIIKGADWLTDGAASVAVRFGIPSLVVGLTIVALGTSTPELVVSAMSAVSGSAEMALGNVMGSNIFNIVGIIGVTAMVAPIVVDRGNVLYDVPFTVLAAVVLILVACDELFNGTPGMVSRSEGLLLLSILFVFLFYTLSIAQKGGGDVTTNAESEAQPIWKSVLFIVCGLAGLVLGGRWLVQGASGLASMMGVSESVIALTIVSMGTSAPELAASVVAARKGNTAMALGNVVGSNVFNVFMVLGTTAAISPFAVSGITVLDYVMLIFTSMLLWLFSRFGKTYYTITRVEGAVLVLTAVVYYTYVALTAS